MGFTSYSQNVTPAKYIAPISEDMMLKGAMYTNENIKNNYQDIANTIDQYASINSLPGADTDRKNEILKDLQNQLQNITYSDLKSSATANHIKSYVNQLSSNKDIQAIYQRGTSAQEYSSKYNKLIESGKSVSPWNMAPMQQIQDYQDKGVFLQNVSFNGNIKADPDRLKAIDEGVKNTPLKKTIVPDPSNPNRNITIEVKPTEDIVASVRARLQQDPLLAQDYDAEFEHLHKGANWDNVVETQYSNDKAQIDYILANSPDATTKAIMLQRKKDLEVAHTAPTEYKNAFFKSEYKESWMNAQLEPIAKASQINNITDKKYDEVALHAANKNIDYQYDQMKQFNDMEIATGLTPNAGETQDQYRLRVATKFNDQKARVQAGKEEKSININGTLKTPEEVKIDIEGQNINTIKALLRDNPDFWVDGRAPISTTVQVNPSTGIVEWQDKEGGNVRKHVKLSDLVETLSTQSSSAPQNPNTKLVDITTYPENVRLNKVSSVTYEGKTYVGVPNLNTKEEAENLKTGQMYILNGIANIKD